jgi:hypothetical protein
MEWLLLRKANVDGMVIKLNAKTIQLTPQAL